MFQRFICETKEINSTSIRYEFFVGEAKKRAFHQNRYSTLESTQRQC